MMNPCWSTRDGMCWGLGWGIAHPYIWKNCSLKPPSVGKLRHWSWLGGGGKLFAGEWDEKPVLGCLCITGDGKGR